MKTLIGETNLVTKPSEWYLWLSVLCHGRTISRDSGCDWQAENVLEGAGCQACTCVDSHMACSSKQRVRTHHLPFFAGGVGVCLVGGVGVCWCMSCVCIVCVYCVCVCVRARSSVPIWKVAALKAIIWYNTAISNLWHMQCRYNAVNLLPNLHNRHPLARPYGRSSSVPSLKSDLCSVAVIAMPYIIS